MLKLTTAIYVEPNDPADDPEDLATTMNEGLGDALSGFPGGEVALAKVVTVQPVAQDELDREGLTE